MGKTGSNMPDVSDGFGDWQERICLLLRTQKVTDGLVTNVDRRLTFYGCWQPLSPRTIALKPEGQRSWTWIQLHCRAQATNLKTNDRVFYNGDLFKVMALLDYGLNGFVEYHLVRDYQDGGSQ